MRPASTLLSRSEHPSEVIDSILGSVADGVIVSVGGTVTANAAARTILALPEGLELRSALLNPRTLEGEPYDLAPAALPGHHTVRMTALDGRELVVDGTVSPVADGAVIVFRDVTAEHLRAVPTDLSEQQRLDQQLVQSGKLAAIGELAAGVAHEINNPLFAILGLTEFLLKESDEGSRARQRLELIQQTGLEIKEIVRALLDFARENAEERHVVPLEDVVRSTVDLVRRTNAHKGVELVDSYDAPDALVNASPNQLKQIFLNLIANARQAMPLGGTVRVEVRRAGDHVVASVSDDGPGIEPAVLERIFEPFFTTKRQTGGTGLGLSVSLGIAESHGGSLTVFSEVGKGAAFTLRLPRATEAAE